MTDKFELKPWIAESSFPVDRWYQLPETDIEVMWFERSGNRWLRHRKVSEQRGYPYRRDSN